MRSFVRDLHFLVAFAGKQHNIAGTGFCDGKRNCFAAIDLNAVLHSRFLQSHQRVVDDRAADPRCAGYRR